MGDVRAICQAQNLSLQQLSDNIVALAGVYPYKYCHQLCGAATFLEFHCNNLAVMCESSLSLTLTLSYLPSVW